MKAYVTGSFDPVTLGHVDVIRRAAKAFEHVTVLLLVNPDKTCRFDMETRLHFLELATAGLGVSVDSYGGLGVDYVRAHGGGCFVRGLRQDTEELEYERKLAAWNEENGVKTVFYPATAGLESLSSTVVRERLLRGDLSGLPEAVAAELLSNPK